MYAQAPLQPLARRDEEADEEEDGDEAAVEHPEELLGVVDAVEEGVVVDRIGAGDAHGWLSDAPEVRRGDKMARCGGR